MCGRPKDIRPSWSEQIGVSKPDAAVEQDAIVSTALQVVDNLGDKLAL